MKARLSSIAIFGLALSTLLFAFASSQRSADQATSLVSTANAEPAVAGDTNAPAEATAPTTPLPVAPDPDAVVAVPAPGAAVAATAAPADGDKKLPANLKPTSPAGEVIKLAQAGVEESVMLTYITNQSSTFNLGSDEIIYLNDLGVASNVVTAMLQHDQGLKTFWANQATPPAQPAPAQPEVTDATAAAPTYVNPPQAAQPAPAEPAPIVDDNYFNNTLSPYGTWVEIDGYGRCWQPTVVIANRGWRPYADRGHWVYSDCGWYWLSDYSWGATTFHYGRWFSHPRYGWCWWPDRVWAPSWVSFRYSGDYCGWAPLPPHAYYRPGLGFSYYGRSVGFGFDFGLGAGYFTFVSWNNFCGPRPWHHRVDSHLVYNHTTIVNNYVTGDHNTVINRGIGRDRVRELSHTEVKTVTLRDAGPGQNSGRRGERIEHDGRTLVVNRPHFTGTEQRLGGHNEKSGRPTTAGTPLTTPRGGSAFDNSRTESRTITQPATRERNEGRTARVPVTTSPSPSVTPTTPTTPSSPKLDGRPEGRPTRERENPGRGNGRPNATAPVIVNGTPSTATANTPPAKTDTRTTRPNLVVIGKPQNNNNGNANLGNPTPGTPVRPVTPQVTAPSPRQVQGQAQTTTRPQRIAEGPTQNWTAPVQTPSRGQSPNYVSPTYTAPTTRSAPTFTPPVNNTPRYTPPVSAPSYSAPRPSTPTYTAPTYTAPARPQQSAPTFQAPSRPTQSAPSYSPPARTESRSESRPSAPSGGGGGGRSDGGNRKDR